MPSALCILALLVAVAAGPSRAAEEPAKKAKSGSSIERTIDKTAKALGKTADKVEKSVKKGLTRTEQAIDSAGKKTGQWLNEKTK